MTNILDRLINSVSAPSIEEIAHALDWDTGRALDVFSNPLVQTSQLITDPADRERLEAFLRNRELKNDADSAGGGWAREQFRDRCQRILEILHEDGPKTTPGLRHTLKEGESKVTRAVIKLRDLKMIERTKGPMDGRGPWGLTKYGLNVIDNGGYRGEEERAPRRRRYHPEQAAMAKEGAIIMRHIADNGPRTVLQILEVLQYPLHRATRVVIKLHKAGLVTKNSADLRSHNPWELTEDGLEALTDPDFIPNI